MRTYRIADNFGASSHFTSLLNLDMGVVMHSLVCLLQNEGEPMGRRAWEEIKILPPLILPIGVACVATALLAEPKVKRRAICCVIIPIKTQVVKPEKHIQFARSRHLLFLQAFCLIYTCDRRYLFSCSGSQICCISQMTISSLCLYFSLSKQKLVRSKHLVRNQYRSFATTTDVFGIQANLLPSLTSSHTFEEATVYRLLFLLFVRPVPEKTEANSAFFQNASLKFWIKFGYSLKLINFGSLCGLSTS